MFSLRIVSTDHYLAPPIHDLDVTHSDFRGCDVKRVPVLRIFGATPAGQKTCMHVHGVFPYLYVPYDGTQPWERYLRLFAASVDKAINVANNQAKSTVQHVFKISIVTGIPMYGYHANEEDFLKIYFYNPSSIRKAADLLLAGAVMNKPFQPHEAHIPYNLQTFIDYNLYGMNLINVAAVKFRREAKEENEGRPGRDHSPPRSGDSQTPHTPVLGLQESPLSRSGVNTPSRKLWHSFSIPSELLLEDSVERQTTCELEVDVVAADILNRLEVDANVGTNPGLAAIWEDEKQRRRDMGDTSQITPPESQDRGDIEVADSENLLRQQLLDIIDSHKAFHDESDSEGEMSQSSQDEYTATPASQLVTHLSQASDVADLASSQDTVVIEEGDLGKEGVPGEEPIISLESIQRVLSFSQSFSQPSSQQSGSGDKSLADVLAAMADESSSPSSSQLSASQLQALEEGDAVIGGTPTGVVDEDTLREDEEETLEMSQRVWEGHEEGEEQEEGQEEDSGDHNMEGMDDSWIDSQWFSDDDKDDVIPQLDGASDEKKDAQMTQRKRLGMTGHVISSPMGQQAPIGYPQYPDRSGYDRGMFSPHSGYAPNYHQGHTAHNQGPTSHQGHSGHQGHSAHQGQTAHQGQVPRPTPFSPGADRYPSSGQDYSRNMEYQSLQRMPRHNWEQEVWQQQQQQQHRQQQSPQHQMMPSMSSSSQMSVGCSGYPQQNLHNSYHHASQMSSRSYPGFNYNHQYPQMFNSESYNQQQSYTSSHSSDFLGPQGQLSPSSYMQSMSHSSPQPQRIAQHHTQSLPSQHQSPVSQHMPSPTLHHTSSPVTMQPHLSPHTLSQRTPQASPLASHGVPYTSSPVFPSPIREDATATSSSSFQKMINSPMNLDSSNVSRSLSRSSMQSTASHASNSSESDLPFQRFTDGRRDDMPYDPMVNGFDHRPSTHLNDLPNMTSVELTSNNCSTSIQHQLGNSHDDLFGESPLTQIGGGSTPSLSVDESNESANENMIDMTGCDDFMPGGYDSAGSDRPNSQNSVSEDGYQSPHFTTLSSPVKRQDARRDSCPSSLSGLMELVSNVNDTNISSIRQRSKLSLKRTVSDSGCLSVPAKPSQKTIAMAPNYYPWAQQSDNALTQTVVTNPKPNQSACGVKRKGRPPKKKKVENASLPVLPSSEALLTPCEVDPHPHPSPDPSYTYSFHVPTPVYKRLKIRKTLSYNDIKIVRMHPMDARRYSLLKIGREIVPIPKLTAKDLEPHVNISIEQFSRDENSEELEPLPSSSGCNKREERVPVLSQFSSYLSDASKLDYIGTRQCKSDNFKGGSNTKTTFSLNNHDKFKVRNILNKLNFDIVPQPTKLHDMVERDIESLPNKHIADETSQDRTLIEHSSLPIDDERPVAVTQGEADDKMEVEHTQNDSESDIDLFHPFEEHAGLDSERPTIPCHETDSKKSSKLSGSEENIRQCSDVESIRCDKAEAKVDMSENDCDGDVIPETLPSCSSEKPQIPSESQSNTVPVADKECVKSNHLEGVPSDLKKDNNVRKPENSESNLKTGQKTSSSKRVKHPSGVADEKLKAKDHKVASNLPSDAEMDFSSLEDPYIEQVAGKSTYGQDMHLCLHTPPLILESDQEDKNTGKKLKVEHMKTHAESVLEAGVPSTSAGFYGDKEHSSEVDSIFSVPQSRPSSRASSLKESSDSSEGGIGRSKKLKKRKYSDDPSYRSKGVWGRQFGHKRAKHQQDDPFKNMILGVHYIVVGRFKGYKSMKVQLKRPKLHGPTVNVHDYFAYHLEEKRRFDRAMHKDLQRPSSAESTSTISEYLMESRIVNCKSSESEELSDAPLEFGSRSERQTGREPNYAAENNCTEICMGGYQNSSEPLETWLEESSAIHKAQIFQTNDENVPKTLSKESEENTNIVNNSFAEKETSSSSKICQDLKTPKEEDLQKSTSKPSSSGVNLGSNVEMKSLKESSEGKHYTMKHAHRPECKSENRLVASTCFTTNGNSQTYTTSIYVPSYKSKKAISNANFCVAAYDSSSDSSHPTYIALKPQSKKSRMKSIFSSKRSLVDKKGKKKSLTPNQRLGVAFLSTRHKRKKSSGCGKLMNSLSILHQATLANLTETVSYADNTDDYKSKYEDVMYKLAMVSPPQSDKGETSPPVPLSPEDWNSAHKPPPQEKVKVVHNEKSTSDTNVSGSASPLNSGPAVASTSTSSSTAHMSMDSIYETPLSSVENNKDSKSPEIPPVCNAPSQDTLPDVAIPPTEDASSESDTSLPGLADDPLALKSPRICLTPLSNSDISRLTAALKDGKDNHSTPPNLGSPMSNPPSRRQSGSGSDASIPTDSGRTPPPCLTPHRSPRVPDIPMDESNNESQHSWRSDRSQDLFGRNQNSGHVSTSEIQSGSQDILTQGFTASTDLACATHDSSSNQSKSSDSNTSTDSRKENLSERQTCSYKSPRGPEKPTPKYSELKLSVRNLLTPRENAINASTLPEHYDMDCPVIIKTSQYEDISSDEDDDDEPSEATTRRKQRRQANSAERSEEKNKKNRKSDRRSNVPGDPAGPSQGGSGSGGGGGSGDGDGDDVPSPVGPTLNVVLHPKVRPPSREMVSVSAQMYGLYTTTAQHAYCSNPNDVQDRPRDGNAHRLDTNRVKDLEEFESPAGTEGLRNWRAIFAADNKLFSSQSVEPLWEKLDKDPSFKFMFSEDKQITISPCHLPPKREKVCDWFKERVERFRSKMKPSATVAAPSPGQKSDSQDDISICELAAEITVEEARTDDEMLEVSAIQSPDREEDVIEEYPEEDHSDKNKHETTVDSAEDVSEPGHKSEEIENSVIEDSVEVSDSRNDLGTSAYSVDTELDVLESGSAKADGGSSSGQKLDISSVIDISASSKSEEENVCVETETETRKAKSGEAMDTSACEPSEDNKSDDELHKGTLSPSPPVKIVHLKRTVSDGETIETDISCKEIPSPPPSSSSSKPTSATKLKSRWDQTGNTSSKPSTAADHGELNPSPAHSTPLRRRSSVDWVDPLCTPIPANQNRAVAGGSSSCSRRDNSPPFVTPQKPGPIRRLSTNTERSLRRSILASQVKSQLVTPTARANTSQIDGPTPKNTYGFKLTQQNYQDAKALHEYQYLTAMSMEVHVETRGDLRPDPEVDTIQAIFYSIFNDIPPSRGKRRVTGVIVVHPASTRAAEKAAAAKTPRIPSSGRASPLPSTSRAKSQTGGATSASRPGRSDAQTYDGSCADSLMKKSGVEDTNTQYVKDEMELIDEFLKLFIKWDPDLVLGWEIQMLSWGYLLQRASHLGLDLCTKISRTPGSKAGNHASAAKDDWAADYTSEINIVGRIVLNLWRLLRHEVTLNIYTFENVAFHVLHKRIPNYSSRTLTFWFNHRTHHYRWRVMEYYKTKVQGCLQIMDQLDLIGKTSEFARVFGIEFYHVLSRGSQYRVESMMLRLAKPMNFIPVSPGVEQRARQKAPECISLNLEPESRFYPHPVVVVDFQSLYPSIMIAYNYCFSTCLGRVSGLANAHEGPFQFGCTSLKIPPPLLKKLEKDVTISPNGVVFLKEHVRKGILPRMVGEILKTRIMVKKAMKGYKGDKTLYRMLDARQLGLKLIANVTYGYTGASFSGRMPCIEVADSIVRKARETLERSIKLVEDTPHWRARVVYGDTDSMFIHLEGRTKDEAFKIGQEIADAVTAMFPKPIKLKFEKVYMPCVLQTKKRYVGFSYETPDQKEPVYDAKGIETVRRDTCSAVAKILERCLKLLFTTRDVSQVKSFVLRQCQKFMEGKVSIQDCIFAKEFRGMLGYKPGACVPGLEIARKLLRQDKRGEPRAGERIPYVIVYGTPGMPLIQLVRQPMEVLRDPTLRINGTYYITKQILPPLHRVFSLIGINVFMWYQDMPKVIRAVPQAILTGDSKKGTISQYFSVSNCPICEDQTKQVICARCMRDPQMVAVLLTDRIRCWDTVYHRLAQVCHTCMGVQDETQPCISLDCPILFRRTVAKNDVSRGEHLRKNLDAALLQF